MRFAIDKAGTRNRLEPRREPYWGSPLARGLFLGFRKLDDGGTWVARLRDDEGRQRYRSLGHMSPALDYDAARKLAQAWAKNADAGVDDTEVRTVVDACRAYVENRKRIKGDATARDAEGRFARTVYETTLARVKLTKLRRRQVEHWRDALLTAGLSRASANRTLTTLKAALNLAVTDRYVSPDRAIEWRDVRALDGANRRRDLFLDLHQRRALVAAASGGVRDLIEAATLTGARAGELVNARRSQFDGRTGTLTLSGKTGTRTVPLAPAALALFHRLAAGKLPNAYLLTRDDGQQWKHTDWDKFVRTAAVAAKLPAGVCLYTLRHSWITAAILGGMTPLEVCRLVGTSLAMIDKHYGHLAVTAARERLATVQFA